MANVISREADRTCGRSSSIKVAVHQGLFEDELCGIYKNRCLIRKHIIDCEAAQKELMVKLYRKERDLERMVFLTGDSDIIEQSSGKIQHNRSATKVKEKQLTEKKVSLMKQLEDNDERMAAVKSRVDEWIANTDNSIKETFSLFTEARVLEVEKVSARTQAKHVRRYALMQEKNSQASERLLCSLLKLVQKQQVALQNAGLVTMDIAEDYVALYDSIEGNRKIVWADQSATQENMNVSSLLNFSSCTPIQASNRTHDVLQATTPSTSFVIPNERFTFTTPSRSIISQKDETTTSPVVRTKSFNRENLMPMSSCDSSKLHASETLASSKGPSRRETMTLGNTVRSLKEIPHITMVPLSCDTPSNYEADNVSNKSLCDSDQFFQIPAPPTDHGVLSRRETVTLNVDTNDLKDLSPIDQRCLPHIPPANMFPRESPTDMNSNSNELKDSYIKPIVDMTANHSPKHDVPMETKAFNNVSHFSEDNDRRRTVVLDAGNRKPFVDTMLETPMEEPKRILDSTYSLSCENDTFNLSGVEVIAQSSAQNEPSDFANLTFDISKTLNDNMLTDSRPPLSTVDRNCKPRRDRRVSSEILSKHGIPSMKSIMISVGSDKKVRNTVRRVSSGQSSQRKVKRLGSRAAVFTNQPRSKENRRPVSVSELPLSSKKSYNNHVNRVRKAMGQMNLGKPPAKPTRHFTPHARTITGHASTKGLDSYDGGDERQQRALSNIIDGEESRNEVRSMPVLSNTDMTVSFSIMAVRVNPYQRTRALQPLHINTNIKEHSTKRVINTRSSDKK